MQYPATHALRPGCNTLPPAYRFGTPDSPPSEKENDGKNKKQKNFNKKTRAYFGFYLIFVLQNKNYTKT